MFRRFALALAALSAARCGFIGIDLSELPVPPPPDAGAPEPGVDASLDAAGDALEAGALEASAAEAGLADASSPDASDADAARSDAAADAGSVACDLTGTWGAKLTVAVSWPIGVIAAGSGSSTMWIKFVGTQSGGQLTGTLLSCGITFPDFALQPLVADETYGIRFPDALFDHEPPYVVATPATFGIGGDGRAGSPVMLAPAAFVVGAALANPITDPWPILAALSSVDTDMDGSPGVTANYLGDAGYQYPRVNVAGTQRADRGYAAARFAFQASGALTSCSELSGPTTFSQFDTHLVGCRVAGGSACSALQRDTLDANRPLYVPGAASYRALKLADGASCADVRAALP